MPSPANVTLDSTTQGDTWPGIPTIGPVTVNGFPPPWTATEAKLVFRRTDCPCEVGLEATVTVVDGESWEFSIPPVPYSEFNISRGRWEGDFQVFGDNNNRFTPIRFTIPIGRTISND